MSRSIMGPAGGRGALERLRRDRRALHRIPELGLDLPETTAYVLDSLAGLPCEVTRPLPSCVCAFFDFGREASVAFRCDIDALPVRERTGLPFASEHSGAMHACGHDGHTAVLLELARRLAGPGLATGGPAPAQNVLLVFQPGEEHPGGARAVCETGVLELHRVSCVFGLHLWPSAAFGRIETRPGAFLAQASELDVRVRGISAHAARRDEGADAMAAACRIALGSASVAEEERSRGATCVVSMGRLEAGTVRNAVAADARLEGTVRTFGRDSLSRVVSAIRDLGRAEERAVPGISVEVSVDEGYPAVVNDVTLAERLLSADLGVERSPAPSMIADDFSFYQARVPGCYLFLGTGRPDRGLHTDAFDFDERVLSRGVDLLSAVVGMRWAVGPSAGAVA